ncbi:MAG: tyrosine-type recombinase/integrase [Clostridiales bacterium]|jgi:site-specific recombinase XerD|nr:tyrosine-type recombinase/integrase [Clostridiales bacterium]
MEEIKTLTILVDEIAIEMERLQYAPLTIAGYRCYARRFTEYVISETGIDAFTEEIGSKYLKEKYGFPSDVAGNLPHGTASAARCIRRIGEYKLYGAITKLRTSKAMNSRDWSLGDHEIIDTYLEAVQTADNSEATKKLRTHHIRLFYEFLGFRGLSGVRDVNAKVISDYSLSMQGCSPVYVKHRSATLRYYFRFLHKNGLCTKDWSFSVPRVKVPNNLNIPALWEEEEVGLLLKGIDRSNPAGKRDYAIILLAVQLGLRISDIASLQLENLRWEYSEIELIQHKTGNRIVHPLLKDIGWALIDYIKNARPQVDAPFVFITINAPYTQMSRQAIGAVLQRNMSRAGIKKQSGTVSGMHSLRHALARRLLEQGTPLPDVADIMGHTSYSSTSPYLKVDIDGLRECGLSLEGVFVNA